MLKSIFETTISFKPRLIAEAHPLSLSLRKLQSDRKLRYEWDNAIYLKNLEGAPIQSRAWSAGHIHRAQSTLSEPGDFSVAGQYL